MGYVGAKKKSEIEAGYRKELIWAPSYLGRDERFGGQLDLQFPHAHNVGEVREFIDNVCEYLDVEVANIIAYSLGCTLAYSLLRGLGKQTGPWMSSWSWVVNVSKIVGLVSPHQGRPA